MIWDFWSNPNSLLFSNSLNLSYIYMCIKNSHAFAIPSLLSLLMCSSWDVLGRDGINVDPPAFYTNGSTFTALCVCICIYSYIHPGEGNGNPLQYSCLENSMGRGTWWATVRGVTQLDMTEQLSTHAFIFTTVIYTYVYVNEGFLDGSVVKNLPAKQEMQVWSLGREDPPEEEMATHSSILAWKIIWTEEPGRLQSTGSSESDTTEWAGTHIWMNVSELYVFMDRFSFFFLTELQRILPAIPWLSN